MKGLKDTEKFKKRRRGEKWQVKKQRRKGKKKRTKSSGWYTHSITIKMTQKRKRGRLLKFIIGENRADHRGVQGGFLLVKLLLLLAAGLGLPGYSSIKALQGKSIE